MILYHHETRQEEETVEPEEGAEVKIIFQTK
jgi:hypothetical protein